MGRVLTFNSPYLLGFEQVEQLLEQIQKGSDGYPPYNIEQLATDTGIALRITLAVAGFGADDLSVSVDDENKLVIRGKQADDADERTFLHRGIAGRQFVRAFVLADGFDVTGAKLENGLLSIDLTKPEPNGTVRQIEIETMD
tara:strand:+ start:323 stop:748 length:426 start_codon:yes stop_codon:yes gene_type:complete